MISKWPEVWEESSSLKRNKQNGKLEGFLFPIAYSQADSCSAVDSSHGITVSFYLNGLLQRDLSERLDHECQTENFSVPPLYINSHIFSTAIA